MEIFISRNSEKHGPYTLDQVHTFLVSGQMQGSDQAWYEGVDDWVPLSQVPGVQLPLKTATPPPPPPQQTATITPVATVHPPSLKFGTAILITMLSVTTLVAEFVLYFFFGFGAAMTENSSSVSGIANFFVGLMVLTAVAGIGAPISSLVELAIKKKNSGVYTFLALLGLTFIFLIAVNSSKKTKLAFEAASTEDAPTTNVKNSPSGAAPNTQVEAPEGDAEETAYLSQVLLREITVGETVLNEDGVFGEIKNTGKRTLKDVELTVYALGKDGNPVWDDTFHPVADSKYAFGDAGEPLKPNYSRKFGYKVEAPSDWNKKVKVEITKVEFADESPTPPTSTQSTGASKGSTSRQSTTKINSEVSSEDEREQLLASYNKWQRAWMNQDLDTFLGFYSKDAQIKDSDGAAYGLRTLRNRRRDRWKNETGIRIEDDKEPSIDISGNRATMSVIKTYNSSLSSYTGEKNLVWKKSDGEWLITEEEFDLHEGGRKE